MFPDRTAATVGTVLLLVSVLAAGAAPGAAQATGDNFEVEITGTNAPVTGGGTLEVTAVVTNTGDAEGSQQIHLKDQNEVIRDSIMSPPLTLAPGESKRVTLTWQTDADTPSGNVSIQSDDDVSRTHVEIQDGAAFDISIGPPEVSATTGENLTVTADVTNTGNMAGSTPVRLAAGGVTQSQQTVELAPGESTQVALTWQTTGSDAGEWTLTASVDGASTTVRAKVSDSGGANAGQPADNIPDLVRERSNSLIEGSVANVSSHDIAQVSFAESADGLITVDKLGALPEDTDDVDGLVGVYRVTVPDSAADTGGTVTFELDAERLDGASPETVLVKHWDGENWTDLNTTATMADGTVRIQAETDNFSMFAVTTAGDVTTPTPTETATATPAETATATPTETATATPTATESPTAAPTETATDDPPAAAMETAAEAPGFGVVAALLAMLAVGLLRKRSRRE